MDMAIGIGSRLGVYEIVARLGAGGMGEVYRARDTRLDREVAIKLIRADLTADPRRRERFEQEARAASRLNHPGIVTLHGIDSVQGPDGPVDFLVMELVPGQSLDARLRAGRLPLATVLDLGIQAAEALAAAHAEGVIHRDLKPANLCITPSDRLKILDFGLARLEPLEPVSPDATTQAVASPTETGTVLGTLGYLSPEQALGERARPSSDLFSLGVVLYQMLTGVAPFDRDTALRSLSAVVHDPPPPIQQTPAEAPPKLRALIDRCLAKDPTARPPSADAVAEGLREVQADLAQAPAGRGPGRRAWIGAAAASLLFVAGITAVWVRGADERWAREEAMPALERLLSEEQLFDAFVLAREIERRIPGYPSMTRLLPAFTLAARIESEPAGAEVEIQDYNAPHAPWYPMGPTPVDFRRPMLPLRVRLAKPGYDSIERAPLTSGKDEQGRDLLTFRLYESGTAPPGMVQVRGGDVAYGGAAPLVVDDFWIDRLEVTNDDYQRFVDDGGYKRRELWPHPIVADGRALTWEAAMAVFLDTTGRAGPATWELGRFPEGRGAWPVGGVSWYEAAAYAEWAGKSLPTFHQWYRAAQPGIFNQILAQSRIGGDGPVAAGSLTGLGPWGTLDMAGNVREWVWNDTRGFRFAAGAAWSDPPYLFTLPEAYSPMRRTPDLGFRCVKVEQPLSAAALGPVELGVVRDFSNERPLPDDVFAALTSVYSYNREAPLDVRVESVDDSPPHWRIERVSIAAAYGDERVPVLVYVPKSATPPLSAVLYLPESSAESSPSSADIPSRWFEFLVRGGRAVVIPIYKNMYERRLRGFTFSPNARRDLVIAWSKDLGRTIDYLATRPDIDAARLGFYGFSLGAIYGPVLGALEPRLRTLVLVGGGVPDVPLPAEVDPVRFASRVRVPTLMVAGRDDFVRPVETAQRPLFALFGTPADQKRLAVLDGGHTPPRMTDVMREVLAWLDRWLGPAG